MNVHSYVHYRGKNVQAQKDEQARGDRAVQEHVLTPEHLAQVPDAEMPIVRTHSVTGRKGLFINEAHTSHIIGLPRRRATPCSRRSARTSSSRNSSTSTTGRRVTC